MGGWRGRGYISGTGGEPLSVSGSEGKVGLLRFSPPSAFCQTCWLITFIHDWLHLAALWPRPAWLRLFPSPPSELMSLLSLTGSRLNEPSSPRAPQKCHCVVSAELPRSLAHSLSLSLLHLPTRRRCDFYIRCHGDVARREENESANLWLSLAPKARRFIQGEREAAPTLDRRTTLGCCDATLNEPRPMFLTAVIALTNQSAPSLKTQRKTEETEEVWSSSPDETEPPEPLGCTDSSFGGQQPKGRYWRY